MAESCDDMAIAAWDYMAGAYITRSSPQHVR